MKKFYELEYVRPDLEVLKKNFENVIEKLDAAGTSEEAKEAILESEKLVSNLATQSTIAYIRNTMNTNDEFYDKEMEFYNNEIPKLIPVQKKYREALLNSKFRKSLEKDIGKQFFRLAEVEQKTQSEEIMDNLINEATLSTEYQKLAASCKTDFMGETCNFYGLLKYMEHTDREVRKQAYIEWAKLYENIAPELDKLYDKLIAERVCMAKKLGFDNYTSLAYLNMHRLDYTAENVENFRKQVLEIIVPFCTKLREQQAKRINVDRIKYYDEMFMYPEGNPNPSGKKENMLYSAKEMYSELSNETGEFFDFMYEHDLFDLETRPGKHLGGYCTNLADYRAPFIFSNFNGTSADVDVLTHEAGHAFEYYLASRNIKIDELCFSTSEINEIHSMTMEYFAYPWMDKFFGDKAEDYKYFHLSNSVLVIPYLVCVDEFQHRVFEKPDMTAMERRNVWRELEKKYMPWRDYDGVEFLEMGGFWMQKQHIFLYPFYYIDYALAQMGACEFYGRSKENKEAAWNDYLNLCRKGGSLGYFDLLKTSNLSNPFEEGSVEKAVKAVFNDIINGGDR